MRLKNLGKLEQALQRFSQEETMKMFRTLCEIHYFEMAVKNAFDNKKIKCPIYLSLGQEAIPAALSTVYKPDWKFIQHRGHGTYIAYGGNKEALIDELLHRESGCARGMGGSASIHEPAAGIVGHDGHMGTQVPIGVGHVFGRNCETLSYKPQKKERGLILAGDAAAEEDYALAALGWASHKKLPVLFVCEDNNLSILTKVSVRRNWKMHDLARAFGMPAVEIADDPWTIMHYAKELQLSLPAFMNIHTARAVWHAGTGSDGAPEWDRFSLVKEELKNWGLGNEANSLEARIKDEIDELWKKKLEEPPRTNFVPPAYAVADIPSVHVAPAQNATCAETIREITREHLRRGGLVLGQCLTAVGWVGGTVPEMKEEEGIAELSMADVAGAGVAVGAARAGRRPIYIVRYQGFQWYNSSMIVNYAAKSKDLWGIPCPVFVRSIAMEGGIGPVASNSHHGIYTRMPGIPVCAPMTPGEYCETWNFFMEHDDPLYVSEHRRAFPLKEEMHSILHEHPQITLFPISATRLNAREAVLNLAREGIRANLVDLFWLKPFTISPEMRQSLEQSVFGGLVIDGDYENGPAKCLAYELMHAVKKPVYVLGLEERTAGFAPHLDNPAPTAQKIYATVLGIVGKREEAS